MQGGRVVGQRQPGVLQVRQLFATRLLGRHGPILDSSARIRRRRRASSVICSSSRAPPNPTPPPPAGHASSPSAAFGLARAGAADLQAHPRSRRRVREVRADRSVLRSLGGSAGPVAATPFCASPARAPYSPGERAELLALAASQRQAWRRRSALALWALGLGTGLRAGELAAATGDDVVIGQSGVAVRVGTGAGASSPSEAPTLRLVTLAKDAGTGYLFCPRGRTGLIRTSSTTSVTPWRLTPPRFSSGRSSFICDHLAAGTPLRGLLYISGNPDRIWPRGLVLICEDQPVARLPLSGGPKECQRSLTRH